MRANLLFLVLAVTPIGEASAQAADRLFGIPFGARLTLSECPENTDKATRPCWIGRPFVYKPTGSRLGSVYLPAPESRPLWAAHAIFDLTIDSAGVVQQLTVSTLDAKQRREIADSISLRFGIRSERRLLREEHYWASWRSSEGAVEMICHSECSATFRTPKAQAEAEAEAAARAKVDATRPKAP